MEKDTILLRTIFFALRFTIILALSTQSTLRLGTRPSSLAKVQAQTVSDAIKRLFQNKISIEIIEVRTTGDQNRSTASTQNEPLAKNLLTSQVH